jgi:hypothetical protein
MRTLQPYIHTTAIHTVSTVPYHTGPHVHTTEATYSPHYPKVQPFSGPQAQKGMKRQTGVRALLQACVARYINGDAPPGSSRMGHSGRKAAPKCNGWQLSGHRRAANGCSTALQRKPAMKAGSELSMCSLTLHKRQQLQSWISMQTAQASPESQSSAMF